MGPDDPRPSPSRKRRPFLKWLAALLVVVGWPVAWRYRPLNALESQLVGGWVEDRGGDWNLDHTLRFTADRHYVRTMSSRGSPFYDEAGSWSVSGGVLRLAPESPPPQAWRDWLVWRVQRTFRPQAPQAAPVEFATSSSLRSSIWADDVRPWTRLPPASDLK